MKYFHRTLFFILLSLFIIGCAKQQPIDELKKIIPTPGMDSGVVTGKMIVANNEASMPANIFLSKNITEGRTDIPPVISFSYQSNPRGVISEGGIFYFSEVPAGTYAITIWTPPGQTQFVADASGQDYLWVTVEVGKTTELGDIQVP